MLLPVGPGDLPAEVLRGEGEVGEAVAVSCEGGELPFCVFWVEEVVAGLRSEVVGVVGHDVLRCVVLGCDEDGRWLVATHIQYIG